MRGSIGVANEQASLITCCLKKHLTSKKTVALEENFRDAPLKGFHFYGDKRIRTADPFNAIEVLYQLSYIPVR
jgi:hypothetical protein